MTLEPVDPKTLTVAQLKRRAYWLLGDPLLVPPDDVPADHFRCFICLRVFPKGDELDAGAEELVRFGKVTSPNESHYLCDDCDEIVSEDQGYR